MTFNNCLKFHVLILQFYENKSLNVPFFVWLHVSMASGWLLMVTCLWAMCLLDSTVTQISDIMADVWNKRICKNGINIQNVVIMCLPWWKKSEPFIHVILCLFGPYRSCKITPSPRLIPVFFLILKMELHHFYLRQHKILKTLTFPK